jgi:hypothetical protein
MENSIVSPEMVVAFVARFGLSEEAALGALRDWEQGRGELDAELVDGEATKELFAPLRAAYFASRELPAVEEAPVQEEPVEPQA